MGSFKGSPLDRDLSSARKEHLVEKLRHIDMAIRNWEKEDPKKAVFFKDAKVKCERLIKNAQRLNPCTE